MSRQLILCAPSNPRNVAWLLLLELFFLLKYWGRNRTLDVSFGFMLKTGSGGYRWPKQLFLTWFFLFFNLDAWIGSPFCRHDLFFGTWLWLFFRRSIRLYVNTKSSWLNNPRWLNKISLRVINFRLNYSLIFYFSHFIFIFILLRTWRDWRSVGHHRRLTFIYCIVWITWLLFRNRWSRPFWILETRILH